MMQKEIDATGAAAYDSQEATPMMFVSSPSRLGLPIARLPMAIWPRGEVNEQVKLTRFKEGIVTVSERRTPKEGRSYYELRYTDIDSGREVRRRVTGLSKDEIKAVAENLTRRSYAGKGYLANAPKAPALEDGLLEAIRLSRSRDYVKADLVKRARPFLAFMAQHYPAVTTWSDIKAGQVEAYLRECERQGLAHDTCRMRLVPVKAAWRRMHQDYPDLVKVPARLQQTPRPHREIECLAGAEVVSLLDWLRVHKPNLWPMGCLQGLAGLRCLEAASLRSQDVDLAAQTITVTDTPLHKPKTRDSYRTIPVCGEVLAALQSAITSQRVRPATGELFTNEDGGAWTFGSLAQRWRAVLRRAARELDNPRYATIPVRKLRASFSTTASRLNCPDRLLKSCLGHSSGDMLGGHYRRIELDELRSVSRLMDGWRTAAQGEFSRKESGNILLGAVVNH